MRRALAPILLLIATSCSPLRTFNSLVPKDPGVDVVARDQVFREGPRGRLDLYAPSKRGNERSGCSAKRSHNCFND